MPNFLFFVDDVKFSLQKKSAVSNWLDSIALKEGKDVHRINVVFTSDEKVLEINKEFLGHNYYTDIITFQEEDIALSGEIYISIDRVKENGVKENVGFLTELHRVLAHGLLHMLGYKDKTESEKKIMRAKEDFYLTLREF